MLTQHFAAEQPHDIGEASADSAVGSETIADVKDSAVGSKTIAIADVADLKFFAKRGSYVLKVDSCDKKYTFRLKDWVTEEAIAKVASETREAIIIKSRVDYSMKTVAQLKEILKEQKMPMTGKREVLLKRVVTLSAPECPTPPTPTPPTSLDKATELSAKVKVADTQQEPPAFVGDEQIDVTEKLFNFQDEEEDIDELTASAKYKLPAAILKCFRNYASREQHTGKRFRAYLLGKVDSHETMQIETVFIPKQDGFDDAKKKGNSTNLWPEDRMFFLLTCYIYIYIRIFRHIYIYIYKYVFIYLLL